MNVLNLLRTVWSLRASNFWMACSASSLSSWVAYWGSLLKHLARQIKGYHTPHPGVQTSSPRSAPRSHTSYAHVLVGGLKAFSFIKRERTQAFRQASDFLYRRMLRIPQVHRLSSCLEAAFSWSTERANVKVGCWALSALALASTFLPMLPQGSLLEGGLVAGSGAAWAMHTVW